MTQWKAWAYLIWVSVLQASPRPCQSTLVFLPEASSSTPQELLHSIHVRLYRVHTWQLFAVEQMRAVEWQWARSHLRSSKRSPSDENVSSKPVANVDLDQLSQARSEIQQEAESLVMEIAQLSRAVNDFHDRLNVIRQLGRTHEVYFRAEGLAHEVQRTMSRTSPLLENIQSERRNHRQLMATRWQDHSLDLWLHELTKRVDYPPTLREVQFHGQAIEEDAFKRLQKEYFRLADLARWTLETMELHR